MNILTKMFFGLAAGLGLLVSVLSRQKKRLQQQVDVANKNTAALKRASDKTSSIYSVVQNIRDEAVENELRANENKATDKRPDTFGDDRLRNKP